MMTNIEVLVKEIYNPFMDLIQAVTLGIVEGLTEFLPISSTGHLILASDILKIPQTEFTKTFEIFIQLGAILAVLSLYFRDFLDKRKWPPILIAFLPTAVVGFILYGFVKGSLLGNSSVVIASLILGGLFLIFIEYLQKGKDGDIDSFEKINNKQAFLIGLAQSVSIIPGVSRAAATIVGGMLLGLKRKTAVEFSFVLAVPTMFAATGLDLIQSYQSITSDQYSLLAVGFITSFIIALIAIKFLLRFIQDHSFVPFGIYRIVIAILFWLLII